MAKQADTSINFSNCVYGVRLKRGIAISMAVCCASGKRLSMMKGAIARVFNSRQKVSRSIRRDIGSYFACVSGFGARG